MKRIVLAAAALCLGATAYAQEPAPIPKHSCDPKPEYPGRLGMQSQSQRRFFENEYKRYRECMQAYIEARKKSAEAHGKAGNEAIAEYNALVTKLNEEQKAASQ